MPEALVYVAYTIFCIYVPHLTTASTHGLNLLKEADVALWLPRGLVALHLTINSVSFPVAIRWLTCPERFVETKNSVLAIPTTDIVELSWSAITVSIPLLSIKVHLKLVTGGFEKAT